MTRTEAKAKALLEIKRRSNATGFIKAFFSAMSKAVDGKELTKKFSGITPNFTKATDDRLHAELGVQFDFQKNTNASKSEKLLWGALQVGVDSASKDMREYMLKKLQKNGERCSGK